MTSYGCINCKQIEQNAYNRHMKYHVNYPFVSITQETNPIYNTYNFSNLNNGLQNAPGINQTNKLYNTFQNFKTQHDKLYPKYWNPIGGVKKSSQTIPPHIPLFYAPTNQ